MVAKGTDRKWSSGHCRREITRQPSELKSGNERPSVGNGGKVGDLMTSSAQGNGRPRGKPQFPKHKRDAAPR